MKTNLLLFTLMLFVHTVQSQTSWQPSLSNTSKQNTIKINPVNPFFGQYQIAYERLLTDKLAIQLEGGFISRKQNGLLYNVKSEKSGFIALPAMRYYFYRDSDEEPMFYFSINYRLRKLQERFTDNEYHLYSHNYNRLYNGAGITIGGQYYMFNIISLEVFGGVQYGIINENYRFDNSAVNQYDYEQAFPLKTFSGSFLSGYSNFPLRAGIILGVVF